jgi:hypothetical protein
MKRFRKVLLIGLGVLAVAAVGYAAFCRLVSPESVARADSERVWIALLKGFEGDVYYVGSDSTSAYFRDGILFWSYYKVAACAVQLPQVFPIGSDKPYVVRFHVEAGNVILFGNSCAGKEHGHDLGKLDRV